MSGSPRSGRTRRQDEQWTAFTRGLTDPGAAPFDEQLVRFREIFRERPLEDSPPIAWSPTPEIIAASNAGALMKARGLASFADLHRWSVSDRPAFWRMVIDALAVPFAKEPRAILEAGSDPRDPRWLPGAEMSIVDACFLAAAHSPAIVSGREGDPDLSVITVGALEVIVNAATRGLRAHGFVEGERIALYMPMTAECVAVYLAIIRAGCIAVSIADSFPVAELRRRLEISGARAVVTVLSYARGGKEIRLIDKAREAGAATIIAVTRGATADLREGEIAWEDLIAGGGSAAAVRGLPDRHMNILFSSGTTGTPKAIPWTHLTPIKCAMDGRYHQEIRPWDVVAWPTNIGWMMGPWLIFASLMNRATIALYEGAPHGGGFRDFVADARVTMLGVIPSIVRAWRHGGLYENPGWDAVRTFSSTGEPSSQEDYLWLMSRAGYRAPVIEYLGGTEIGGGHITGSLVQPASPATFTTPALGIDLVILDEEGRPVAEGGSGELFLVPPAIGLSQHLLNADHGAIYDEGAPAGPGGAPLRRHGDRIARLHGGFYKAQGRVDDAMNLGGIKISSMEIERAAATHPAVSECAAVAVQPGGDGAERLVIFAVCPGTAAPGPAGAGARPRGTAQTRAPDPDAPEAGAPTGNPAHSRSPDPATLRAEIGTIIARDLNPLFRVHDLVIVDALPRTASHKVMRRELRERYVHRSQPR